MIFMFSLEPINKVWRKVSASVILHKIKVQQEVIDKIYKISEKESVKKYIVTQT